MKSVTAWQYLRLAILLALSFGSQAAQEMSLTTQAQVGGQHYANHCSDCHLANLRGSGHGVALSGVGFLEKWAERSTAELFHRLKTSMPPSGSAGLSDQAYLELVAFILAFNNVSLTDGEPLSLEAPRIIGSGELASSKPSACNHLMHQAPLM